MRTPEAVAGMLCPVCRVSLAMSDRQGVEIDYCPQCRGVWLDRGELDKIIDRQAASEERPAAGAGQAPPAAPQPWGGGMGSGGVGAGGMGGLADVARDMLKGGRHGHSGGYAGHGRDPRYGKRKKSFLEQIFD